MAKLSVSTFTIPKSIKSMTIVWYNDYSVPRGVKTFFRQDTRYPNRIKIRIKDDKGVLGSSQRGHLNGALHEIAKHHDYNWEQLVTFVKRSST